MIIPALLVSALITVPRVWLAICLAVCGSAAALLLQAWCIKLSYDVRKLPMVLLTAVIPLLFLALTWPQLRPPIFASLVALLLLSSFSRRSRRALRLLLILFTGLIPLFLLIGIDDVSWSAGFLLVHLGIMSLEREIADTDTADREVELLSNLTTEAQYFVYYVSVGFLWILLFAALLWHIPDP